MYYVDEQVAADDGTKSTVRNSYPIPHDKSMREAELATMIAHSPQAKEVIRKEFGIPDMPSEEIIRKIELANKTKRSKKKANDNDPDEITAIL